MHDPSLEQLKSQVLDAPNRSAELVADAPRLANGVAELESDRRALLADYAAYMTRHTKATWRGWPAWSDTEALADLVRRLKAYRQRVADLLYQAYTVDLGGET